MKIELNASPSEQDWRDALELCKEILELCSQLPERAEDFQSSIEETVTSMSIGIEKRRFCSDAQWTALGNIKAGVERWL